MIARSNLPFDQCHIGGAFVAPHGQDHRDLVDPATREVVASIALADVIDVDRAMQAAKLVFRTFGFSSQAVRLALMERGAGGQDCMTNSPR